MKDITDRLSLYLYEKKVNKSNLFNKYETEIKKSKNPKGLMKKIKKDASGNKLSPEEVMLLIDLIDQQG